MSDGIASKQMPHTCMDGWAAPLSSNSNKPLDALPILPDRIELWAARAIAAAILARHRHAAELAVDRKRTAEKKYVEHVPTEILK